MNPDKIRKVLNVIFLIGAVASVIVYYAVDDMITFWYVCGATLFFKVMEFFIRFANR